MSLQDPGLADLLAAQTELVRELNGWVFGAPDASVWVGRDGDGVAVAAAAHCRHSSHPLRRAAAVVGVGRAGHGDAALRAAVGWLDRATAGAGGGARVRVPAGEVAVCRSLEDAGFRLTVRSEEWIVDPTTDANRRVAGEVAGRVASRLSSSGLRVAEADPGDDAVARAAAAHYALVHEWNPPAPFTVDDARAWLLDDLAGAVHVALVGGDVGREVVGISVLHREDRYASCAGRIAYCGATGAAATAAGDVGGTAADVADLLLAARVSEADGELVVELDVGDGANAPLAAAVARYERRPAGEPVLVFLSG